MKVNIRHKDYLAERGISKIEIELKNDVGLDLEIDESEEDKVCKMKMYDKIGVSEVQSELNKEGIRKLIELLKSAFHQL